ncbi:hypothetical protein EDD15DRAFT_2378090 [Pisolithus albus]|nr:hypothetical protein EDD15DRAFT_2378090 [Pisolithus albus]
MTHFDMEECQSGHYHKTALSASALDCTKDANSLDEIIHEVQAILPGLYQECDQLVEELEQETAEITELEACDQDYPKELKASIAEQGRGSKAKLGHIEEKLKEVQTEKNEVSVSIGKTEQLIIMQKNSELEMLQTLHIAQVTKVDTERFEFVYGSSYVVCTCCVERRPMIGNVQIRKLLQAHGEEVFPPFCNLALWTARKLVNRPEVSDSLRKVIEFVAIELPFTFKENPSGFAADVALLYPSVKAKIQSTKHDARVVYGPIERDAILQAVGCLLKDVTPTNNHACLLHACIQGSICCSRLYFEDRKHIVLAILLFLVLDHDGIPVVLDRLELLQVRNNGKTLRLPKYETAEQGHLTTGFQPSRGNLP